MDYTPEKIDSIVREANRLRNEEFSRLVFAGIRHISAFIGSITGKRAAPLRHAHR